VVPEVMEANQRLRGPAGTTSTYPYGWRRER
jgi:hypothetical protein